METTYVELPVVELSAHPDNLRDDVSDGLADLVKTIKQEGVLEPLVVVPLDEGGHRVVAGHRRLAAAMEAGLERVPCMVRADRAAAVDQMVTMMDENLHRKALTPSEEAKGYRQLALLGLSDSAAAKRTGVSRDRVRQARAVAADPVASAVVSDKPGLSFGQALAIADVVDYLDDAVTADELAETAVEAPGEFEHYVSRVRQRREDEQRQAQRIEELTAQGTRVITDAELDGHAGARRLEHLTSADTPEGEFEPLDPEDHAGCPGHAVSLVPWDPDRLAYWCLDPAGNGHRTRWPAQPTPEPVVDDGTLQAQEAQKREERRTVIANNKAWRAARPVRRDYIGRLLSGSKVPKGTLRYVIGELMADPYGFGRQGDDDLLAELTSTSRGDGWGRQVGSVLVRKAKEARLPLVLLAQHAADVEAEMPDDAWRQRDGRAARWLRYLADTGYTLSEVEQLVVNAVTPQTDDTGDRGDSDRSHDGGDDDRGESDVADVIDLRDRVAAAGAGSDHPATGDDGSPSA